MTAPHDLAALKKLAREATPGQWECDTVRCDGEYGDDDTGGTGFDSCEIKDSRGLVLFDFIKSDTSVIEVDWGEDDFQAWDGVAKKNAEYIAAANPATMLALLERLEAAEQKLAVLGSLQVDAICAEMKELVGFSPTGQVGGASC
jgi:Ead/Ea22-like protein